MSNWAIAITASAPSWLIILHAKYHLSMGAPVLIYFLDDPGKYSLEEISLISDYAHVVLCDQAYWDSLGGKPARITQRQMLNLQSARKICGDGWLLHIDIDEFLHVPTGAVEQLFDLPEEIAEIRLGNVERVLPVTAKTWSDGYFRLKTRNQGLLQKHYGATAEFFGLGLANYFHGKSFVAARPGVRQSIHGAIHEHPRREIVRYEAGQQEAMIVHYPCITPGHFVSRYLGFLKHGTLNSFEFKHQRAFRAYLVNEARKLGPLRAILKGLQHLHYCSDQQARDRLADGLYAEMPEKFTARIRDSAMGSQVLDLRWADRSFAGFLGLLRA